MAPDNTAAVLSHFFLPAALFCLLLSACATHRWAEPVTEEEHSEIAEIIATMQATDTTCPESFDSEALIFWKSPLDNAAVTGYLQLLSPSFIKFIVSNPLGQPIYAFASNGDTFQSLYTRQQLHIRGSVQSLAVRKEIPQVLVKSEWFALLTGHLPSQPLTILQVQRDVSNKTVWLLLSPIETNKTLEKTWLHLDPEKRKVLGYLFLDREGKTLAEILYENSEDSVDYCTPNEKTTITNLPWGTEIIVELKDIQTDIKFSKTDFTLPVPNGYRKQLQP